MHGAPAICTGLLISARQLQSALYAIARPSVCPSVCLSVRPGRRRPRQRVVVEDRSVTPE